MSRRLPLPLLLLLPATALAFAGYSPNVDYSRLPEPPSRLARFVDAAKVSIPHAVKTAEDAVKARATAVEFVLENEKLVIFVRLAAADDRTHLVQIDAASGAILDKKERGLYPGLPVRGDPVRTPSGIIYFDLLPGSGEPLSDPDATVTVHYTGWFVDGTKFDSSVDRNQPLSRPLATLIKGWVEGLSGMKIGGKRKLIIPHTLAYGEAGMEGRIPPRALLIFDIELLAVGK